MGKFRIKLRKTGKKFKGFEKHRLTHFELKKCIYIP